MNAKRGPSLMEMYQQSKRSKLDSGKNSGGGGGGRGRKGSGSRGIGLDEDYDEGFSFDRETVSESSLVFCVVF